MIHTEDTIVIKGNVDEVFEISSDVERYPEFIPTYKEVRILSKEGPEMIVERESEAGYKWRSRVFVDKDKRLIKAEQLEGPLKGMKIEWKFAEIDDGTRIVLTHDFEYKKVPLIGNLIGRLIVSRIVKKMATQTLEGVKRKVEEGLQIGRRG
ncbi:MAG: SRPBCC family protein [bacterium]|nr:SRPBCC family protein [bacterium]